MTPMVMIVTFLLAILSLSTGQGASNMELEVFISGKNIEGDSYWRNVEIDCEPLRCMTVRDGKNCMLLRGDYYTTYWSKDGRRIAEDEESEMELPYIFVKRRWGRTSIKLDSPVRNAGHSGTYTCTVEGREGETAEKSVAVNFEQRPE